MKTNTIREYLQELTRLNDGATYLVSEILNKCEERAKLGLDYHIHSVLTEHLQETVEYLTLVAKLAVEVTYEGATLSTIEINWSNG